MKKNIHQLLFKGSLEVLRIKQQKKKKKKKKSEKNCGIFSGVK